MVSRMEYDLAIKIGQAPNEIIFNGPVKTSGDIALALANGSLVNLDGDSEIKPVLQYARHHPDKKIKIGLRINIGLSDESGRSHIQNSLKIGRFGFAPANIENVTKLLSEAKNVDIIGLHGHTSTTDRNPWCFEVITRTLCDIAAARRP